tara:strand:+ start:390 stop:1007 length:618 start_codon:yes stop_codon:yes gene_type:complete
MKKILAIFISIIILAGCESGKDAINTTIPESYKADEEKIVEQKKKEMAASVEEIPEWFLEQDEIGDLLTAKGTATSSDLQMSIDKAMITAKRELASKIEETISDKTKRFLKDVGIDENSKNYDETIITTISRIDNVELSGFKVDNRKVINLGTKYRSYIKLVYPVGTANKLLVNKINKEEELKLRLESSEAFKELEKEIADESNN